MEVKELESSGNDNPKFHSSLDANYSFLEWHKVTEFDYQVSYFLLLSLSVIFELVIQEKENAKCILNNRQFEKM